MAAAIRAAELEAVLKARDEMQRVLQNNAAAAKELESALQHVGEVHISDESIGKLQSALGQVQREVGSTGSSMEEVARTGHRSFGPLGGAIGALTSPLRAVGGALGDAKSMIIGFAGAQYAMQGINAAFGGVKSGAINLNAELETATLQFTTLMHNSQAAKEHVQSLFAFAAQTPYQTEPLIEASRIMRVFGGSALDTMGNLKMFGDMAAATGANVGDLAAAASKMYAEVQAGKPLGLAARELMLMGALTPQVSAHMEDMQKKGASAAQVWAYFTQYAHQFNGAMKLQMNTWQGLSSTLKDNVELLIAKAFHPLFDAGKHAMQGMIDFFSNPQVQQGAARLASGMADGMGKVIGALAPVGHALQAVFNTFTHGGNAFDAVTAALMAFGVKGSTAIKVGEFLHGAFDAVVTVVKAAWPIIQQLAGALMQAVPYALQLGQAFMSQVVPALKALIPSPILDLAKALIGMIVPAFKALATHLDVIKPILLAVAAGFVAVEVASAIMGVISAVGAAFAFLSAVWEAGTVIAFGMAAGEWAVLSPMLIIVIAILAVIAVGVLLVTHWKQVTELAGKLGHAVGGMASAVGTFFHNIWSTVTSILGRLVGFIEQAWHQFTSRPIYWIAYLLLFVMTAIPRLSAFIAQQLIRLAPMAWDAFTKFVGAAFSALGTLAHNVGTALGHAWDAITGWVGSILPQIPGKFVQIVTAIYNEFNALPGQLLDIGGKMLDGLWNGIKGALPDLGKKLGGAKDQIVGAFKDAFGIHSPSRVLQEEVGRWLPAGIAEGVNRYAMLVQNAVRGVAQTALPAVSAGGAAGAAGAAGAGLGSPIQITVNNPDREPASTSIQRELRKMGYMATTL